MTGIEESSPVTEQSGRHGGSGGLSASELIARSRAASPDVPARPSRADRRAAEEAAEQRQSPSSPTPVTPTAVAPAAGTTRPVPLAAAAPPASPSAQASAPVSDSVVQASVAERLDALPTLDVPAPEARHLSVVDGDPQVLDAGTAAASRKSRAGRNLPAAIGVGLGLGALVIATLVLYRPSFVILVGIVIAVGVYEMVTAISTVEARPPLVPLLASVVATQAAAWFHGPEGLVGALLLTVLGLSVWRLADGAAGYLRDVAAGNLVALYLPFLAGFAALMAHADDGVARIIIFILTVVCSDTGGYAMGALFGKHPMAPTVSPKKSWEGFGGSILAGSACGVLMMVFCFHHAWWKGLLFGLAVVVTATLGDLGESMIKRDLGLKDMGKLLPGHGGLMDRLDSLLPCAPVAYLVLVAFLR
jgi:phosphatidate cytidylyltransferase